MNKINKFLSVLVLGVGFLAACGTSKKATTYYLDNNNNLVVRYEDNTEEQLGAWGEDIIHSISTVTISTDGFYIINGVKTTIKENTPIDYYLDASGNLIAKYVNGSTKNLGKFNESIVKSLGSVSISIDEYYVINGVKTSIKAKQPASYNINSSGHLIVTYNDGTKSDLGNFSTQLVNGVQTIKISDDGFYIINDIKTSIKAKQPASYNINSSGHLIVTYNDGTTSDLGNFSEELVNGVQTIKISNDGYYIINGVATNISAIAVYTVSFNTGFSSTVPSQKVKDGYKVTKPNLTRTGYTLDGWFCNEEEWRFNSDVVKNDMTLNASWTANTYTVSFVNEKGTNPEPVVVTYDSSVTLPKVSPVDGYTFAGWYNGATKVNDGTWKIASDTTLTAKWTANTYTVTLNPGDGSVSKNSVQVTYGKPFTMPIPTNSYGVFTGWLLDGEPVTDNQGNSLANWTYLENKTFTVDWTIKVYNASDLQKLNTYKNGQFILMNDIDMTGVDWVPVGTKNDPFTGKLDGDGHSIKNLSVTTAGHTDLDAFGLFGYVKTPSIDNLTMFNFKFESVNISKPYYVGSIAGYSINENKGVTMSKCISIGTFNIAKQSSSYPIVAGGIMGYASTQSFCYCTNYINISNATTAGGIAGIHANTEAYYCCNYGNIECSDYGGGIIGDSSTSEFTFINACGNFAEISSAVAGGIVGQSSQTTTISQSVNKGDIEGTSTAMYYGSGGIVGKAHTFIDDLPELTVSDCYNTGDISGYYAGGINGSSYYLSVTNCYSVGSINAAASSPIYAMAVSPTERQCLGSGSLSGSLKCTIGYSNSSVSHDCYHTFSNTSDFTAKTGTYVNVNQITNKSLYVDNMFWTEYNPQDKTGCWVFVDDETPKLHIEDEFYIYIS